MKPIATILALLIRHALTGLGLVDLLDPQDPDRIAGAVMVILGVVWSIFQKTELRKRVLDWIALSPLLLLLGCPTTALTINPPKLAADEGQPVIVATFYGRGCVDAITYSDGSTWVTLQSDATTDWIFGRAAPRMLSDSVSVVMAVVGAPVDLLMAAIGAERPSIQLPSEVHGCGGVLSLAAAEESEKKPPSPSVLQRLGEKLGRIFD